MYIFLDMKMRYGILILSALVFSSACWVTPVNTNHELLIVNSRPEMAVVSAEINGETQIINDIYYKAFFKPVSVRLAAETIENNPRFSFWWFNSGPVFVQDNPWDFDVSTENWEITAVFNWEENTDPVVMWDDSILYINQHEGQTSLMHWQNEVSRTLFTQPTEKFNSAWIYAFHPAEHAFYRSGSQVQLIDADYTVDHSFSLDWQGIYPVSNGTSLIHTSPEESENTAVQELYFISKKGAPERIQSFSANTFLEITPAGSAERLFAVEYRQRTDRNYEFRSLHTINMEESSAISRLKTVPDVPASATPESASLESSYYLLRKMIAQDAPFGQVQYQFIVTDGQKIMRSPVEENPSYPDAHLIYSSHIHWVSDDEFMARKTDGIWLRFSIHEGELTFIEDQDYELPKQPSSVYTRSTQEQRGPIHPENGWVVEALSNSGPIDLYITYDDNESQQITGIGEN